MAGPRDFMADSRVARRRSSEGIRPSVRNGPLHGTTTLLLALPELLRPFSRARLASFSPAGSPGRSHRRPWTNARMSFSSNRVFRAWFLLYQGLFRRLHLLVAPLPVRPLQGYDLQPPGV